MCVCNHLGRLKFVVVVITINLCERNMLMGNSSAFVIGCPRSHSERAHNLLGGAVWKAGRPKQTGNVYGLGCCDRFFMCERKVSPKDNGVSSPTGYVMSCRSTQHNSTVLGWEICCRCSPGARTPAASWRSGWRCYGSAINGELSSDLGIETISL